MCGRQSGDNTNVRMGIFSKTDHVARRALAVFNNQNINLESLDYPEVSTGGDKTTPISYQYFGNRMNDNWKLWYLRARITERTFDFWWMKNLYYYDRPQLAIWLLFGGNLVVCALAWIKLRKL